MFARLSPVVRAAASAAKNPAVSVRCMSGYGGDFKSEVELARHHRMTYDDMPVPTGSWQEANSKRQIKYNIQLGLSVALVIATYFMMKQGGVLMYHEVTDLKKLNIDPSKPIE